jgi:hypothetical protein
VHPCSHAPGQAFGVHQAWASADSLQRLAFGASSKADPAAVLEVVLAIEIAHLFLRKSYLTCLKPKCCGNVVSRVIVRPSCSRSRQRGRCCWAVQRFLKDIACCRYLFVVLLG